MRSRSGTAGREQRTSRYEDRKDSIRGRSQGTVGPGGQSIEIPENRFGLAGRHQQPFYGGSQLYVDLFAISDLLD